MAALGATSTALAAEDDASHPPLRLFVDCPPIACDLEDLKRQIDFVSWVRDRADAEVYVLVTERTTSSGGLERTLYVLRATGSPAADTVRWFHPVASSDRELRDALARALRAVLARDLIARPEGRHLRVSFEKDAPPSTERAEAPIAEPSDRWDHWVMRLTVDGTFDGEQAYRAGTLNGGASASRVTDSWKLGIRGSATYAEGRYEFSDGSSFTSVTRGWGAGVRCVRSVFQRWSLGARVFAASSSFANLRLETGAGPAIEFNVFPYHESSRRAVTVAYELTAREARYDEITLYGKRSEQLLREILESRVSLAQPWGTVSVGTTLGHYLHQPDKYRAGVSGTIDLQLARGFSISLNGFGLRVRDQLSLRRGEATDEEVLTRIREIETSYQYFATVGVSYTFGSIFSNVVNQRLDPIYGEF